MLCQPPSTRSITISRPAWAHLFGLCLLRKRCFSLSDLLKSDKAIGSSRKARPAAHSTYPNSHLSSAAALTRATSAGIFESEWVP